MRKNISKILLGLTAMMGVACGDAQATQGSLDDELIRRVVRAHSPEIEACYATALTRDAEANGVVLVTFTIGTTGEVTAAKVGSSDIGDETLHGCMREAVQGWLFPRPEGGSVEVDYPFVLVPQILK
ncbi:AgmX/PglI C-terminal domain-containing protein [Nannocystis pusilla]|uniref:AgmX/PglI C-terminal domain-containing protein n=1 Tax=Nannocystis pusilla TaxID=889268 RepID=A0A9X3ERU7_9BACT|nr:AgmX/PglI C-terminal domain-containing protein [Nannocystis pusilla]MCY1008962.1 AgmX/PglI C-terminal domain-containing protein [Nannocystis pusilla]